MKIRFCHEKYWDIQYEETVYDGRCGTWQEEYACCPEGMFITGG